MANSYFTSAGVAALLLAAPAAAFAQHEDTTVEAVVAVGTLDVQGVDPDRIGGSLTVLDSQDLEVRQVRLLSDVLRDVPGVAVSRLGAPGAVTAVRIRGSESNHTLNLVDGVEANDPIQGEMDYATFLADDLARVEVLRGQQSALYGSDAIGGVVSYTTPTGRQAPGLRLRAEGGSFDTVGAAGRFGGEAGKLDYVVMGAAQWTGGYPTQTDGKGTRDVGAENQSLGAKVSFDATDKVTLRGVARFARLDADFNDSPFSQGSLVLDTPGLHTVFNGLFALAAADFRALDGRWVTTLEAQSVDGRRDTFDGATRSDHNEGTRAKGRLITTLEFEGTGLDQRLTGAVDAERETYRTGNTGPRRRNDNVGIVADYAADFGKGGFGAAVRHDANDLFEDATTYRLQAYLTPTEAVRLRAALGTGIKNPGQFELFGFGFGFVGNPDLKPEESQGWEAGGDLALLNGRAKVGATYFHSILKNEIFSYFGGTLPPTCPDPGPGNNTACNRTSESRQQGVELYVHAQINDAWTVDAAYTWLDAEENGFEEIRRAPNIASLNIGWRPLEPLTLNLNIRYNGKQQDSNFSILTPGMFTTDAAFTELPSPPNPFGRVELPAYTLVNLDGSWRVNDRFEVYGRVENLTDEDYWEVITYPTAGRAAYAGVRARF